MTIAAALNVRGLVKYVMKEENVMVDSARRPRFLLPHRWSFLVAWTVVSLLVFSVLGIAEVRNLNEWPGYSSCRVTPPIPPPAETSIRTISATQLLVELAKDAIGVSQLTDGLFGENVSRSHAPSGVHVLIRFLYHLSGGNTIPSSPGLTAPYAAPEPHSPRPLKNPPVIEWSASS
jgi:hypothetical protein